MNNHIYTYEEVKLKIGMRRLWEEHIIWTRQLIVDITGNLASIDKTLDRLLKNQEQIGNYIKPFFGDIAGNNLTILLKNHIIITSDLLYAIKTNNITNITILEEQWMISVENISTLFSTTNVCYSQNELIDMFNTYLILIKYQFIARMSKDYNADIMYFDMGLHQILTISDYLTKCIIKISFE